MADSDTSHLWQRHYQIIAGINENVCEGLVDDVLKICEEKLVEVLLAYEPFSSKSLKEWEEQSKTILEGQDSEMRLFVHRVSKELDLDSKIAWSMICNFLIFDFFGKVDELQTVIKYESNIKPLLTELWIFYTTDRIFLLKSLRFILEKVTDEKFVYYEKFVTFLKTINLTTLWKNLLKNFEKLLIEIDLEKCFRVSDDTLSKWVKRNNREQVEVLLLMMHVADLKEEVDKSDLANVLKIFLAHGFGRYPIFDGSSSYSRQKDLLDIECAEIGVIFAVISRYWNQNLFQNVPVLREFESHLESQTMDANNLILFALSIFKTTVSNEYLEDAGRILEDLLNRLVFQQLANFITCDMFQDSSLKGVLLESANKLLIQLLKLTDDRKLLYEQDGFVQVICEIYKKPFLFGLEYLGVFIQLGLDMFPYKMDQLLNMAEAIMTSDQYPKVMKVLQNCPHYCSAKPWEYLLADTVRLKEVVELFRNSPYFLVPVDTVIEKYECFGECVTRYRFPFDFFVFIEELMKLLSFGTSDLTHDAVISYVTRATKFLGFLVKNYPGRDFLQDELMRNLMQRIDCIPTYNSRDVAGNFDMLCAYFETKCALVKHRNVHIDVAFPDVVRKRLFPKINAVDHPLKIVKALHADNEMSLLFALLQMEESRRSHKLIIEYTQLLEYLLMRRILHIDIMYSGVLYLLYIVFPNHKQWKYESAEPFQENQVLNGCLGVFSKLLQRHMELELSPTEDPLQKVVKSAFLNESNIISTFYDIFTKDKYYLSTLMHQESNWIGGKTLRVLETTRLELALLLLMIKSRAACNGFECWKIDEQLPKFAKSVSAFFATPFSCILAVLAGKFLEVLARDAKIPLMACLGLDYDQVHTLFLERLRDPMEDEEVKINILNIISTCITSQKGMTAAFFNVQASKKWHNPDVKKIEGDTVSDFMMDYLQNIKKDVGYLKSPLQVGILKVMSKLWHSKMYHLIQNLTVTKDFWKLVVDPLMRPFEQVPSTYTSIFTILTRQIEMILNSIGEEDHTPFYREVEKFFSNVEQLKMLQGYISNIFANDILSEEALNDRKDLIIAWTELLLVMQKQDRVEWFSTPEDFQYHFIEIAFDGYLKQIVNQKIRTTWLQMVFVTIDKIGLSFKKKYPEIMRKILDFCKIIQQDYEVFPSKDRTMFWSIFQKIVVKLKSYFEANPDEIEEIFIAVGPSMQSEYRYMKEKIWQKLETRDGSVKEFLQPWTMIMYGINFIFSNKLHNRSIWFAYQQWLEKMLECSCKFIEHKDTVVSGKIALRSIILYAESPMYLDFESTDMVTFFDSIERTISTMLNGRNKINVIEHKNGCTILNLIFKFSQVLYLDRYQEIHRHQAFEFLKLNTNLLHMVMTIPERNVDLSALDLLTQVMKFYDKLFKIKVENGAVIPGLDYICKLINTCMYVCLRPKHIAFYYLDNFRRLKNVKPDDKKDINELTILVMDRLIGILGLCFSCLYRINHSMLEILDLQICLKNIRLFIENDFAVPRFELPIPEDVTYGKLVCLAHFLCKTISQIQHKKSADMVINASVYKNHTGFVEHQDLSDLMPNQNLSSYLLWNPGEEKSGLSDPWLADLNYKNVLTTTEKLMVFMGQQAVFKKMQLIHPDNKVYFRSNLYSELLFIYDFAKRITAELVTTSPSAFGDMDFIRKYLIANWKHCNEEMIEKNFLLVMWFWFPNICQAQ